MKSVGDEQRIQALFREFTTHELHDLPTFNRLWSAEVGLPREHVSFKRSSIVIASTAVIAVVFSLAIWKSPEPAKTSNPSSYTGSPKKMLALVAPIATETPKRIVIHVARRRRHNSQLSAQRRKMELSMMEKSLALSRWQSPTSLIMEFATSSAVARSLPQLTESVRDLKSFLPNAELKESNQ